MYESNLQELVDNGHAIQSSERTLKGLKETIDMLIKKIEKSGIPKETMYLSSQLQVAKEQYYIVRNKSDQLIKARDKIIRNLCTDYERESEDNKTTEAINVIDKMVMKLLAIDDVYMETHKTSNSSIMIFVESLLKKKKTLIN